MFRSNYQGGAVVEIFSGQGKDPVAKWKLYGGASAIQKEYNKEVKGFVYCLEGSSQTVKMQMPENGKMSLGLLQRFLVLQVNIPPCKDFSIELVITDSEHLKRRLHLSTVHKELSATHLHAKIPFVELKRNIWSALCIDLVSFTGRLFKGFLTLDGITLFATCKVRRIFTMKTEPTGMSEDDTFLSGAGLVDSFPRSCQFPPNVSHVTQVLNMEALQRAGTRTGPLSADCGPDQATAGSTSYRRARPQGALTTASGSRVSVLPPQTARRSTAASDGMNRTGSSSSRMKQKVSVESRSISNLTEDSSDGEPSHIFLEARSAGTPGGLQPRPPKDRAFDQARSKMPRLHGAGRDGRAPPDALPGGHRSKTSERCAPPSASQDSRQQPVTPTERRQQPAADEDSFSRADGSSGAESLSCSIRSGSPRDLRVCSSWESNEGSEPRLALQEEVFTFLSKPHSPKRGHGQGDHEKMAMGNDQAPHKDGGRHEARPEDDFIGSESDEDETHTTFRYQRIRTGSNPATPRSPDPTSDAQVHPESRALPTAPPESGPATSTTEPSSSGRPEPAGIIPPRCLSPGSTRSRHEHTRGPRGSAAAATANQEVDGNTSVSLCRRLLQEVKLDDFTQDEGEDKRQRHVDYGDADPSPLDGLRTIGDDDDEELRMLASLKREQEEDECRASGLSASQIRQCNVSISMCSDDTSTWTHISAPANQGHHYQKEMNPLLQSNPREWMDVLSPPIMPPSQQRRSGSTWNNQENLIGDGDESMNEEENEDEYLNLLYDPCLNCYFDPKTGKYYELA